MIMKNEEKNLAGCLDCLRMIADEIIIVDTGQTDKTKEMAKALAHGLIEVAKENIRYYAKKYIKVREKKDDRVEE